MVILSQRSLSFKYLNSNCLLIILICTENLGFFIRNMRSFWDNLCHYSSNCFNTQWKWGSINDKITFCFFWFFTTNNTTLNSSPSTNSFIRVNTSVGVLSIEEIFNDLSNFRNTRWTTHKNDFVNLCLFQTTVIKSDLHWLNSFLKEIGV